MRVHDAEEFVTVGNAGILRFRSRSRSVYGNHRGEVDHLRGRYPRLQRGLEDLRPDGRPRSWHARRRDYRRCRQRLLSSAARHHTPRAQSDMLFVAAAGNDSFNIDFKPT